MPDELWATASVTDPPIWSRLAHPVHTAASAVSGVATYSARSNSAATRSWTAVRQRRYRKVAPRSASCASFETTVPPEVSPTLDQAFETSASKTGCGSRSATTESSPRKRTGERDAMPIAAYDQRPSASEPAVTAPPKRPDGPASKYTGIQKCGASEGHDVYPVSRTGTVGALSNGAAGGTGPSAAPFRMGALIKVQPVERSDVYAILPSGSMAGERAPSGSAVTARAAGPPVESFHR